MKPVNCEHVQDRLPDLVGRRLNALEAASVQAHLQTCGDCRAELNVVSAVASARLNVPASLESRIGQAVRGRAPARARWPLALAASIAVAVIGGSAILAPLLNESDTPESAVPVELAEPSSAGWFSVDDAFISGASSLGDLTDEELKQLLVELDT